MASYEIETSLENVSYKTNINTKSLFLRT